MSFIVKQPNGLYCKFSTMFDCPVRFNMTEEEYIESCVERAKREAIVYCWNNRMNIRGRSRKRRMDND